MATRYTRYEEDREAFGADAYKIRGYGGVAWRVLGWQVEQYYDEVTIECLYCRGTGYDDDADEPCKKCEGNGEKRYLEDEPSDRRTGMIVARMIGDDRDFVLDAGDITPISREDYCAECGQIGCACDGYDRDDAAVEANIQSAQDGGGQPDPEEA